MAVERKDLYDQISEQLPVGVDESTRIAATRLALGKVNAADFFAAQEDFRIAQRSKGTKKGEAKFIHSMQFFGKSR
ncbi:MAG: hypothetical protein Q8P89_02740 [bacterium]|nr:hypothetical protein [bacterium]